MWDADGAVSFQSVDDARGNPEPVDNRRRV